MTRTTTERVAADYIHVAKVAQTGGLLELPGAALKWYELRQPDAIITDAQLATARNFVRDEVTTGRLDLTGDRGFVIQHRTGDFHLLLICTWRGNNELWETVYHDADGPYRLVDRNDPHLPTFCVWEMGIVTHEARAWSRFLRSARTADEEHTYLADEFEGEV